MKKFFLFLFIVILLLFVGGIGYMFMPLKPIGPEVDIVMEPGMRVQAMIDTLVQKKVIPNATLFTLWLKIHKRDRMIQSGQYTFYENDGIVRASQRLLHVKPIELSVTIPEGLIIEQTAAQIATVLKIDMNQFIHLCFDQEFITSLGIKESSLEGYLFPNTYRFLPTVTAREVITAMVKEFFREYSAFPVSSVSGKLSQHQVIILASIVEKEAALPEERPRIASVFHNRLRMNIPLGADPTVRYIFRKFSGPLYVSELKSTNPYNTRIFGGLPPGPICSPGKGAIEAALFPAETKDLYFVARWDGSNSHEFSRTNAQHDRAKMEIRKSSSERLKNADSKQNSSDALHK